MRTLSVLLLVAVGGCDEAPKPKPKLPAIATAVGKPGEVHAA